MPFFQQDQDYHEADAAYYPAHEPFEKKCNDSDFPNYIPPRQGTDRRFRTCDTENFEDETFTPVGFERQRKFVEPYAIPGTNMVVRDVSFWRDVLAIIGIGFIIKTLYEMWSGKKI